MMLALKSGPQIAAKVGNPAGLLCRRIWYSVGKSGVLGITEYRQGRPLANDQGVYTLCFVALRFIAVIRVNSVHALHHKTPGRDSNIG